MKLSLLPKVAILTALFLMIACKKKELSVVGLWDVKNINIKESMDSVPVGQLKGFTFEFKEDGSFIQSLPDGQLNPGKYKVLKDTLMLTDTILNVSYLYHIEKLEKEKLDINVFNSFFNDEMQLKMQRSKKKAEN